MAKYGSTLAEVKVYINGKQQAKKELEELKAAAKNFSDQMDLANNQMLEAASKMAESRKRANEYSGDKNSMEYKSAVDDELRAQTAHDEAQKRFKENQAEYKKYNRLINETEKLTVDLEVAMSHLSEQDIKHLRLLQRQLDAIRNQIDPTEDKDGTFLNYINNAIKDVSDTIRNRKGELIEFADIADNITTVDDRSLDSVIKRLKELISTTGQVDSEKLKKYKEELSRTESEKSRRVKMQATDVQKQVKDNTWKGTIEDIQKAIELQKQYQKTLSSTDTKGLKSVEETIEALNRKLDGYQKKQTASVMKDLDKHSYAQIQAAVAHAKKLQEATKPGSSAWNRYGKQIAEATIYLEKWNDQAKRTKMIEISKTDLGKMSNEDLKQNLRYWDGLINGIGRTNVAINQYKEIYERLQTESAKRSEKIITSVEGGDLGTNISQMQQRLKTLQDFRLTIESTDTSAYERIDASIAKLKEGIKETEAGFMSFDSAMAKASTLASGSFDGTLEDLEKIQKVIREGIDTRLNLSDPKDISRLKEAQKLLEDISMEQEKTKRIRLSEQAAAIQGRVSNGFFGGSIEETRQAIETLKKYQETLDATDSDAINAVTDSIRKMNAELETASRERASKVMQNPTGFSVEEINEAIKVTEKLQASTPDADAWTDYAKQIEAAKKVRDKFADDAKFEIMSSQFIQLDTLSKSAVEEQRKYWEGLSVSMADTDPRYKTVLDNMQKIKDAAQTQLESDAATVMGGTYDKTIEGTKQAIELLKKYQSTLDSTDTDAINAVTDAIRKMNDELETASRERASKVMQNPTGFSVEEINEAIRITEKIQASTPDGSEWTKYAQQIEKAKDVRDKFADDAKFEIMSSQFLQFDTLSKSAVEEQRKYWEGLSVSMADTDPRYKTVLDNIQKIKDAAQTQLESDAATVMGGTYDKTIEGTKQAIELLKRYQSTLDSTDTGAINAVTDAIRKMNAELETASRQKAKDTLTTNLATSGTEDIRKSVEILTKYQGTLEPLSSEWRDVNNQIEEGKKRLKELTDSIKMEAMSSQFAQLSTLSVNALSEQKKYWTEVKNTYSEASSEYKTAVDNLKDIKDLEDSRIKGEATKAISDINAGNWDKTIEETQQAIKLIEEFKKQLHTSTETAAIDQANKAIETLQQKISRTKQEIMPYNEALKQAKQIADGTWDGTIDDLEKIRKSLEYHKRNSLKIGADDDQLKEVDKALQNINNAAKGVGMSMKDIDKLLKDLDSASVEDLEKAAKNLQQQLHDAARGTKEYAEAAAKLREVNLELKKAKKEWEGQENVIARTAKRLMAYVAVYGGFNEIMGKMREVTNMNLQLSDSMADVQKTTGLTGIELQELGRSLEGIDTRTTTAELYQLAAAAGQIGLKTQEDVLGFAKAANTISVALNELGAEGSASLMKIATLTGEVGRYGTEGALMKVGSAINELTANSAATAGPIADFISRVGGIASASRIAISEMAALGAATDASAQSIEIAGTSMNKFITALLSNTENIAYATNLNARELQDLINEGNTMQAVIRVLESMQTMDRSALSGAMKELGSEGARMNQYIASMVANLDMLKRQLSISKEAFDENVSVINEYNVKQESALGILQRMKNSFLDTFVNSKMTVVLKNILETIASIPGWLEKHRTVLLSIRILIAQILVLKLPMLLNAFMKQLSGMYALLSGPIISGINAFRHAWKQAAYDLIFTGKACNTLTISLRTLGNIIKAHPILTIASLVTAGIVAWLHFREETDKVAKAMSELSQKHNRQIEELNALRTALEATNTSYAVKAAAMREINSLYSKYLGFELSELDTYEKKKAALDYINAKLKENQTLEMVNRQKEVYNESFSEDVKKNYEGITEALINNPQIGAKRLTEAVNVINESIKEGAKDATAVIEKLNKHFNVDLKWKTAHEKIKGGVLDLITTDEFEHLEEYVKKYKTLNEQLSGSDDFFNEQTLENQRTSDEALTNLAISHQRKIEVITEAHEKKLAELKKNGSAMTEAEQIEHLQTLLKEQEQYQKTAEQMLQRAKERDEQFIAGQTDKKGYIDLGNMHAKYGGTDTGHIVSSRVNELNAIRKEMEDIKAKQSENELKLAEENSRLLLETQKKNNEEQIELAKSSVEEKKKLQDELNKKLISSELEWNSKYAELQTWATSDARKKWNETTEEISRNIRSLQLQIAGDPWGKAFDLKDWKQFPEFIEGLEGASVTSLVQGFEKLRDNTKLITQDVDAFNKMFDLKTPLKDLEEVNTQVYRWLAQIRKELKGRGRNTTGAPIFTNAKEELDNVMKNLQTHFLKRQAEIRKAYIDGTITTEEMDRRLSENDRVFINERIELRKVLLGENSNFMKELYPDLSDTDLAKLRLDLEVLGDEVTADIRKDLEEDENTVREGVIKIRKAIEKELMANDPFATLRENLRGSLDELELMSSQFERDFESDLKSLYAGFDETVPAKIAGLDEESQRKRLDFLISLAQKSYTVDREGLRKMFESHGEYYNWVTNLDDTQMQVMLNKLQWFYDESLIKQNNYKERILKGLESSYLQQEEKMTEIAKIEWKIEDAKKKRSNLQQQNKAYEEAPLLAKIDKQTYDSNIQEIISYNQAIKQLEEELLEEKEKAANKNRAFRNRKERETKDEMEASISALKAYYNEMEAWIRKEGSEKGWTTAELDRKLLSNTIAREKDEQELRKLLLGEKSTFDPFANNAYKGVITGTTFFGNSRNLKKQADDIKIWGKALQDGMRNEIAKSEVEVQKDMRKMSEGIKKALLEGDMFGKFENEFAEMLDEIGVLTSKFEKDLDEWRSKVNNESGTDFNIGLTEEERANRIAELTKYADKAYQVNGEGLRALMSQNTMYSSWVTNLNNDEMNILLQKLRNYYDERLLLTKKYQERMSKEFEAMYKQTGQQADYEKRKTGLEMQTKQQGILEGMGVRTDYESKRQGISENFSVEDSRLQDEINSYKEKRDALAKDLAEIMRSEGLGSEEYQNLYNQYEAAGQLIVDTELKRNELLAQSQRDLTQVYMDEWTKRAEKWGQVGEMFGDFLGEQLMLEKQANDARARGDLETAKKIEQQQKQNKNNLIQGLLNFIVDEAALWAKELGLKMMFNALSLADDKKKAIEEATLQGKSSILSIFLSALTGQAAEAKSGLPGLVTGAIVFAATMALQALAKAAISNMFPEASVGSTNTRKLSTGMLTYAEGNYPVLGNDGKVYDAKYEGANLKTGVYGGGAHFGIFSEKQPEMIVDGKTTQKIILNYPYIYDAITTIAKNGRLKSAMPTFASGDYPAGLREIVPQVPTDTSDNSSQQMERMAAALEQSQAVNKQLLNLLKNGISAHLDGLETYKQQKKNERFLKRRGID